jgi:protein SCO1/2
MTCSRLGTVTPANSLALALAILAISGAALTIERVLPVAPLQTERAAMPGINTAAPFDLLDQRGNPITADAFQGHPSAVFFGFTHCPEVCPTTLYEMSVWMEHLGSKGDQLKGYFVSLDPERDTPEILGDYISSVSERITGITGSVAEIERMADAWGVYSRRVPLDDGGYTMDHTASVFLLDSAGQMTATISYGEDSDSAIAKLEALVAGNTTTPTQGGPLQ